jgi:hypothetical protein
MKIYQPPSLPPKLDLPPQTPTKALHAEQSLVAIAHKLQQRKDLFSSPTQRQFDSTIRGTQKVLIRGELLSREFDLLQDRVRNQQNAKIRGNRTVIQKGGVLTGDDARRKIKQKEEKQEADRRGH